MTSSFKFIHAADIHLDSPQRGISGNIHKENMRNACRSAFTNLINLGFV